MLEIDNTQKAVGCKTDRFSMVLIALIWQMRSLCALCVWMDEYVFTNFCHVIIMFSKFPVWEIITLYFLHIEANKMIPFVCCNSKTELIVINGFICSCLKDEISGCPLCENGWIFFQYFSSCYISGNIFKVLSMRNYNIIFIIHIS